MLWIIRTEALGQGLLSLSARCRRKGGTTTTFSLFGKERPKTSKQPRHSFPLSLVTRSFVLSEMLGIFRHGTLSPGIASLWGEAGGGQGTRLYMHSKLYCTVPISTVYHIPRHLWACRAFPALQQGLCAGIRTIINQMPATSSRHCHLKV